MCHFFLYSAPGTISFWKQHVTYIICNTLITAVSGSFLSKKMCTKLAVAVNISDTRLAFTAYRWPNEALQDLLQCILPVLIMCRCWCIRSHLFHTKEISWNRFLLGSLHPQPAFYGVAVQKATYCRICCHKFNYLFLRKSSIWSLYFLQV